MQSNVALSDVAAISADAGIEIEPAEKESFPSVTLVKYLDIPLYLVGSSFYKSLSRADEDDLIPVPSKCYQVHDFVEFGLVDLAQLLRIMMFWGLETIPESVLDFCHCTPMNEWVDLAHEILDEARFYSLKIYCDDPTSLENVNSSGRWEIFEHWMKRHPPESEKGQNATTQVAKLGNQVMLTELWDCFYPVGESTCEAAARGGYIELLQYLHALDCPWDAETPTAAAKHGHLECLQYAHEQGAAWSEEVTLEASKEGHQSCLQYALEHGCPIHSDCTMLAAMFGRLECLQFLHTHNAKWDAETVNAAAGCGQLHILRFLFEHNCPYDCDTVVLKAAASFRNPLPCLQYLIEEQFLSMGEDGSLLAVALQEGNFTCVEYLIDQGCPLEDGIQTESPWTKSVNKYTRHQRDPMILKCIEYAIEHGWVCGESFVRYVYKAPMLQCIAYLEREGHCVAPIPFTPDIVVHNFSAANDSVFHRDGDTADLTERLAKLF